MYHVVCAISVIEIGGTFFNRKTHIENTLFKKEGDFMVKKILSWVLSLTMVMAASANLFAVHASEADQGTVTVKYYDKDPMVTYADGEGPKEITSVNVNDYFYAVMSMDGWSDVSTMAFCFAYKNKVVQLVKYDEENVVDLDSKKDTNGRINLDGTGGNGVKVASVGLTLQTGGASVVDTKLEGDTDLVYNAVSLTFANMTPTRPVKIENETKIVALKFKAVKSGDVGFYIPVNGADTIYSETNNVGFAIVAGDESVKYRYKIASENGLKKGSEEVLAGGKVTVASLTVGSERLATPTVTIEKNSRTASWNAVEKADKYSVTIVASDKNGETYNKTTETTGTSVTIPAEIKYGSVTVSVAAKSNDADIAESTVGSATEKFTIRLDKPTGLKWNDSGDGVSWNKVEGANGYEVTVKKNGEGFTGYPKDVTDTNVSIAFDTVTTGADTYTVEVKAKGDGAYTLDSEAAVSSDKKLYGNVKDVIKPAWKDYTSFTATWTAADDAANVEKYEVMLMNGTTVVKTLYATKTEINLSEYMKDAGLYTFSVRALGKTMSDGQFGNSKKWSECNAEYTVSVGLKTVTDIKWNGRTVTWTDPNADVAHNGYTVTLSQNGTTVGNCKVQECSVDFDEQGIDIGAGVYTVSIVVNGNNKTYMDSAAAKSDSEEFKVRLADPTGVEWNGKKGTWDEVTNATAYEVEVYFNGLPVELAIGTLVQDTEIDFADVLDMPGVYTFTVKALSTKGYDDSKAVESDKYTNTVTTVGSVKVELYSDAACTTKATSVKVGDIFYAAIEIADMVFDTVVVPFRFNPNEMQVVDANGNPVVEKEINSTDLVASGFVKDGTVIGDESLTFFTPTENGGGAYVDNQRGIASIIAYANNVISVDAGGRKLAIVKMRAEGKTSNAKIDFASANVDGDPYVDGVYSGFEYALEGETKYPAVTTATIGIEKGKLAKMAAPVWGSEASQNTFKLTWNKVESKNATGYEIVISKDGTAVTTKQINDTSVCELDVTADIIQNGYGSYTATIKAIGDGTGAESSDTSDASAAVSYSMLPSYVDDSDIDEGTGGRPSGPSKDDDTKDNDKKDDDTKNDNKKEVSFTDIAGHWAEENIIELAELGVVEGYSDNTYRPNNGTTRAEFAKIMVTTLGLELVENGTVYDDTADHWAKDYIATATEYGLVNGVGENRFAPDKVVTREQMAAIIYRISGNTEEVEPFGFADRDQISEYAKTAVDYVANNGIMVGFDDNTFRPANETNRAQVATVILRLIKADFFEKLAPEAE